MSDSGLRATTGARAEEVTTLPPPSAAQLNKIVKLRTRGLSKIYICLRNTADSYAWVQMAISE
ncbi:hypothetical protein ES703_42746 [subsurface metagenome]